MLHSPFRSLSFRAKLILLFSILIAAISLFMYVYFPMRLEQQAGHAQVSKTQSIAGMTAFSLSSALFFSDIKTLEQELDGIKQNKDIVYIVIHNDSGIVVASYYKEIADKSLYEIVEKSAFLSPDESVFKVSTPIVYKEKSIGTLYLGVSLQEVKQEVEQSRKNIALVSIIVFIIGMSVVYSISSVISRPLRRMVKTIETISEGNLSHRAEVDSENEIGQVASAFNRMVAHLQEAYANLEELNRTLEKRVETRTHDLQNEISERNLAEVKLRESEERYRRLVEMSPDAIMVHQNGKFVFMNLAGAKLFGSNEPEAFIGKPILDFVHPDYREIVLSRIQLIKTGETAPLIEEKFLKLDGGVINVEVAAIPSVFQGKPAVEVVVRDITLRKQTEREQIRLLKLLQASLNEIYVFNSTTLKFQFANYGALNNLGYTLDEITRLTPLDVKPGFTEQSFRSLIAPLINREKSALIFETEHKRKDGSLYPIEVHFQLMPFGDEQVFVSVILDITDRKRAEKDYQELEQKLIHAQKLESIGTLAGGIAHDFNNILAIILGYSNILQRGIPSQETLKQSLKVIDSAVDRGANLVRQILTFARKTETVFGMLDANIMIKEHIRMLSETFPKVINLSLDLDNTLPPIMADPTQFLQTLMNLCINARDAMPNGGKLTIRTRVVNKGIVQQRFQEASEEQYLRLSVEDTGVGISKEITNRIFDPFFTTKEKGKGTGLGLAVVYGIAKSHKGFIDIESEPGKGTVFHLYFPIPQQNGEPVFSQEETTDQVPGGEETILFIEDEEPLRELVTIILETNGYTVIAANDGEHAIELFRRYSDSIDLVFSDIGLPKLEGEQVFHQLKEMKSNLRMIFATGFIEPVRKSELLNAGVIDILEKPYEPREILRSIRNALDRTSG